MACCRVSQTHNHMHHNASGQGQNFFSDLLMDYVPRQMCMFKQPEVIWLHVFSDFFIALAYFSIPVALVYFASRRKDIVFNSVFMLFALFIMLCGTTHIFNILAMWHAYYRLDGLIKLATAIASIGTAIVLWQLIPSALALPSLEEIRRRKDELETLVQQRTAELTETIRALRDSKERAETANAAKTDFLANMSHEIRTPMNAIMGLTDILERDNVTPEKRALFYKTMRTSADQLLALINDILDISKIENKGLELHETTFSLQTLIAEIVNMNAIQASRKNILLINEYGCPAHIEVMGDAIRLRQILTNLVGNAIKFTEKGSVTVHTACREVTTELLDITIKIIDTGIGIPNDKLDNIFTQFYQADTSLTRKYEGAGLGLAITKTLLELMGGAITVESKIGEGSCFTVLISLPTVASRNQKSQNIAPETSETSLANKARVLLIEDNEANILVATGMLEAIGYDYTVIRHGGEALEALRARPYDAVLMDIQMPGIDGYATTRLIREEERKTGKQRIPIIGVTAHAYQEVREKCLNAGMNEKLTKPYSLKELQAILEHFMSK